MIRKCYNSHMEKTCTICTKTKELTLFRKDKNSKSGYAQPCKECDAERHRTRYAKNPEKAKAWMREHYKRNKKKYHKKSAEYIKRNPEKNRAHMKVRDALKYGKLEKKPCEVCGENKVEAHHKDYSRPLEVNWLCPVHHGVLHRKKIL